MPRGANAKREREYEEMEREFEKEGRYKGREKQVAARIVNKQRAQFGETKREKKKDREGKSPDRDLPIKEYQHKTIDQVTRAIRNVSKDELKEIERYERRHKNRKTLLATIKEQMKGGTASGSRNGDSKDNTKSSRSSGSTGSKKRASSSSNKRKAKSSGRSFEEEQ